MAGKCKEMNKIKQELRLHLDGESNRSIGRKLDLYKGMGNKYITLAESCGIPIPKLLSMEEPEIERMFRNHPRSIPCRANPRHRIPLPGKRAVPASTVKRTFSLSNFASSFDNSITLP